MTDWMNQALCREVGTDVFFAEEKGASPKQAKRICAACSVTTQCLEYALNLAPIASDRVRGVWGGTTFEERKQLRHGLREVS